MLRIVLIPRKGLAALTRASDDEYEEAPKCDPEQEDERQQNEDSGVHPLSHGRV